MQTVNIGILAHVDAGKTSLTERLLYDTGVIDRLGSVDAGTTQTDTGDIERRRGITIRSAVATFTVGDRRVNLIDTPGHSDFVAEVERALGVLDGAVLVLSAVEGVQPHTRVLMRTLRALRLPTLIFVNKMDRAGARSLDEDLVRLLRIRVAPLSAVDPWVLAEADDELLAGLIAGAPVSQRQLWTVLRSQTAAARLYPLVYGSAITGAGVPQLLAAVRDLLPPAPQPEPALRGRVFAIERGALGEKVALVRSYGGRLHARQRVPIHRPDATVHKGHVSAVHVVGGGDCLAAGQIARVHGLPDVRIGDQLGTGTGLSDGATFARPSLETTVRARRPEDALALHAALVALADQDPLIQTEVSADGESTVLLYGEVQKEVLATTLAEVYGVEAVFTPTRVVHLERPIGTGTGFHLIESRLAGTVGLRVEPATGVQYGLAVELGALPLAFHKAIEEAVRRTLRQGVFGWPVTDISVTLTHCGYWSPVSTAGDFRAVTPLVLAEALAAAGTRVYEPCHQFSLDVPADRLGPVAAVLAQLGARISATVAERDGWRLTGEMLTRHVHGFQQQLPGLSSGEGVWTSWPAGDRPVTGPPPARPRTDGNPFDRATYLRHLAAALPH
jgi:ribosomal protection tetracycline resistance protein